mmetsp:Transcript_3850/g.5616  ORF Transcript_3850/g.5616 Transcript_3850/m.5616 type:complete len:222 (-) Transcript_3850:105-770(-)
MRNNARSSLTWLESTGLLRPGFRDISTWVKTTKTVSPSPPLTLRMDPTPTVDPVSSPKPPSCALELPVMDVNNLVSSVETRMDSRSAPLTTKRRERSVSMLQFLTVVIPMRLVSTHMKMSLTIMTNISRFTNPVLEISCTPRMMVSRDMMLMETFLHLMSIRILLLGGTCLAAVLLVCLTETSLNMIHPPLLLLDLLLVLTNLLERRSGLSTLDLMPIPVS